MRILVTGGAGFIGSHIAEYYALQGEKVVVLDNLIRSRLFGFNKQSVEYNWQYLQRYQNVKLVKGDVSSEKDIKKVVKEGLDVVIHTAGQPGVPSSISQPRLDFQINALGTFNLLECLRKNRFKGAFVYCSTNKVYGENVDKIPLQELPTRYSYKGIKGISEKMSVDLTGHTPYGVSKLVGDLYVQEYGRLYGIKTGVFRMSCIYGPRQFGFEDQGWVAWFIIATLRKKPITIYGDGKQVRDLLFVSDVVKAFDSFIKNKNKCSEVYNIGGGKKNTISLLEFLEIIKQMMGKKPQVQFNSWRLSDQKVYITDFSKAKKQLNWQPAINVAEGIGELVTWIKERQDIF